MKVHVAVTAVHVRVEAERRILSRYPIWKQVNLTREGGEDLARMSAFIDDVRAASNAIEDNPTTDYTIDPRWPI